MVLLKLSSMDEEQNVNVVILNKGASDIQYRCAYHAISAKNHGEKWYNGQVVTRKLSKLNQVRDFTSSCKEKSTLDERNKTTNRNFTESKKRSREKIKF